MKWAYEAQPDVVTHLLDTALSDGDHPWHHATIVTINKPGKPDYSVPKAHRPISLLECMGKVLEKIVANRFQRDIEAYQLLSNSQFGSRPQHCTVDAGAVLIHCVQAAHTAGHTAALLMFNISGFFDNIDPNRAIQVLKLKGFPTHVQQWTHAFLTKCTASLQYRMRLSERFEITHGMPQGSPLSPILSALYTSPLLDITDTWSHKDLNLYVDDSAILAISATANAAALSAH